jgi:ArsR family transcriptional regulator
LAGQDRRFEIVLTQLQSLFEKKYTPVALYIYRQDEPTWVYFPVFFSNWPAIESVVSIVFGQIIPEKQNVVKLKSFSLLFGTQLFKALGDPSRLRILNLMIHNHELSITDLELILNFTQTKTARLMGILKNANLVQSRRVDQWVLYQIKDEANDLLNVLMEYLQKEPQLIQDLSHCQVLNSNRELSINKLAAKQYNPTAYS